MKNEELEIKTLLRQNTELVSKLQWYRRENEELKGKNENLNTWVQNLSEVFAAAAASWQSVTLMEETLLALTRKKTDARDRTLLKKYISHFKTFASIIDSLGEKLMNAGHSDQSALDAKGQLDSFVKNYEIFFKEFVESYFKFNEESSQLMTELKNKPEAPTTTKAIMNQALEQKQKIKEFEAFVDSLKDNFKMFESHNCQVLLSGAVKAKEEEIQALKKTIYTLQRRIKAMFDYNNQSVVNQLEGKDLECTCGGVQLSYMIQQWEQSLKAAPEAALKSTPLNGDNEGPSQDKKVDEEKYAMLQEEKQSLISRNKLLLEKIDKMRVQYKLTDEMVLKSNVYLVLRDQCNYLMDYCSDLLGKLHKNQEYLAIIEKNREEEIREIKKKWERHQTSSSPQHYVKPDNSSIIFKTQALTLIKELRDAYTELAKSSVKPEQTLSTFRKDLAELSKANQELHRKLNEYHLKEQMKSDGLEFRHQKFKVIESEIGQMLASHKGNLEELWKEFMNYVKSRDRKIKDLENLARKKDKQIMQKSKYGEVIQQTLDETEGMYRNNKLKLDKTEAFISKMEKELISLAEEAFHKKTQFEQEKGLLTIRLKAETEARNKLEEKMSAMNRVEEQVQEMRRSESEIQKNYQVWLEKMKEKLNAAQIEIGEKELSIRSLTEEIQEREKQLSKLQGEKEAMKSELREQKNKVESLREKSEDTVMKMEWEEYKGKIMCNCTGEREREVSLRTCPHLFCRKCIEDTQNNRNRKCPLCRVKFTKTDIHEIKWN